MARCVSSQGPVLSQIIMIFRYAKWAYGPFVQEVSSQVKAQSWLERLQENLQISASKAKASKGKARCNPLLNHHSATERVIRHALISRILRPMAIDRRSQPITGVRGAVYIQYAGEIGDAHMAFITLAAKRPHNAAGIPVLFFVGFPFQAQPAVERHSFLRRLLPPQVSQVKPRRASRGRQLEMGGRKRKERK